MSLKVGDVAPVFSASIQDGSTLDLTSLIDRGWVVLYFYPKDFTPGCTVETQGFQSHYRAFKERGAEIVGVSRDKVARHEKFHRTLSLSFPLVSDVDAEICESYGVWKPKTMFGKTVLGIVRSTFLIAPDGKIKALWSKVRVKGHVESVLQELSELQT